MCITYGNKYGDFTAYTSTFADIADGGSENQSTMESELYVAEPTSNIQTVTSDHGPPPPDTK